jgi:putative transposase
MKRYASEHLADAGYELGFRVIPRRWVVERTFSWLGRQRRYRSDYERLASTEEAFTYLEGIRLLLARLAPAEKGRFFKHLISANRPIFPALRAEKWE